jgi:hypothetical protein
MTIFHRFGSYVRRARGASKGRPRSRVGLVWTLGVVAFLLSPAGAQDAPPSKNPSVALAQDQQETARQFGQIEELMLRLAGVTSKTDPVRAGLLKQAFGQSKEKQIALQFREIEQLLAEKKYGAALARQKTLRNDLTALLNLLQSEDRDKKIDSEKRRIREYLERLAKILRQQEGIAGSTEAGDDAKRLAEQQADAASKTEKLRGDIRKQEESAAKDSEPGESGEKPISKQLPSGAKPPEPGDGEKSPKKSEGSKPAENGESKSGDSKSGDGKSGDGESEDGESAESTEESGIPSAQKRLKEAQRKMREAQKKLDESDKGAKRSDAVQDQRQAIDELKQAQAELEKILRQMREEQIGRTLAMLEARFRKMLELQTVVYEATKRLDQVPKDRRDGEFEREAARLGGKERDIATQCERALLLLREDGSAAALLEAAGQIQADMVRVAELLAQPRVDGLTQGIEEDVLRSLEEVIAALAQARERQNEKNRPQPPGDPGDPTDPPLVDALQELRMIRAMQMRINRRTAQYAKLVEGEQAKDSEIVTQLRDLSGRQKRLVEITRDIVTGRTE